MDEGTRVLLVTGYDLNEKDPILEHPAVCGWVQKPFNQAQLGAAIREALDDTRAGVAETAQ